MLQMGKESSGLSVPNVMIYYQALVIGKYAMSKWGNQECRKSWQKEQLELSSPLLE